MTTVIKTDEEKEEKELSEGEREVERDLGAAEAEIEHHDETLGEHAEAIEQHENSLEFAHKEIRRIWEKIEAIPQIPTELLTSIQTELAELRETITKATTQVSTHSTEPPEQEHHEEKPEKEHLGDRLW